MNPVRLTQLRSLCTILANQTHNGVSNLIIEVSPKSMVVVRSSDIFAHDLQTAHGLCRRKKRCSESSGAVISQRPPLVNARSVASSQLVAGEIRGRFFTIGIVAGSRRPQKRLAKFGAVYENSN